MKCFSFSMATSSAPRSHSIGIVNRFDRLEWHQIIFDVLLAMITLVLGLISQVEFEGSGLGDVFLREADWFHSVLVVSMAAPLALRRIYPATTFAVVLGAWVIDRALDYPESLATVGVLVVFYTIGTELSRRRSFFIGGLSAVFVLVWTTLGAVILESVTAVSIATTTIATVTPLLIGREMRARRERAEELRRRVADADREREESARRAVEEERARIARELHDVVAHQMTVMTIQAEGARRIADGTDPRVRDALDTIKATGHSALAEMRRVVGLLRETDDSPELSPLPRLDDLESLVEKVRSAGVRCDLSVQGEPKPLPDGVELSAYRIVQESLTNAVRHGGPEVSANVRITYGDDSLDVVVLDDGRGAAGAPSNGGGHGLVGMRERVAILGGSFEAGAKPGGGYRVRARIPYQP
jgi:signal transduction histidine kinase